MNMPSNLCTFITNVKFKIGYKPLFQSGIIWWNTKYRMLKDSSNSYMFKASFQYSEVWRKQVKQCCRLYYTFLSTTLLFRATNWKERTNKPRNWWHNRAGRQQYTWEGTKDFGHQLAQIFLCSFSLWEVSSSRHTLSDERQHSHNSRTRTKEANACLCDAFHSLYTYMQSL